MNHYIKSIAGALLIALCVAACGTDEPRSVTAVSWGGSFGKAVHEGVNIPFAEETGIEVRVEDYNGGLAEIKAQAQTGNISWDVVDLEIADAVRGCDEGLLERIDIDAFPPAPDGTPAAEDFPEDVRSECGIAQLYYSTVYAYNDANISGMKPSTIADFFDLEAFPGRRGMRKSPQANLEFALMADGVSRDEVYATMDTPEGLDRAYAKLETIKEEVVWWETGAQPAQMLADGEVIMSTAWNGRIFNAQVLENQPFVIVWDSQLLDVGQVGIVKGTPRLEAALEYVKYATSAEAMSRVSRRISYSPARKSGLALVTTHVQAGVEMAPHLPSTPENMATALRYDAIWWADNQDEMNERFSAWLAR